MVHVDVLRPQTKHQRCVIVCHSANQKWRCLLFAPCCNGSYNTSMRHVSAGSSTCVLEALTLPVPLTNAVECS